MLFRIKCEEVLTVSFYGWSLPFDTQNYSTTYLVTLAVMFADVQPMAECAKCGVWRIFVRNEATRLSLVLCWKRNTEDYAEAK